MGDDDGDLDENLNVDRDGVLDHFCFLLWDSYGVLCPPGHKDGDCD